MVSNCSEKNLIKKNVYLLPESLRGTKQSLTVQSGLLCVDVSHGIACRYDVTFCLDTKSNQKT